MPAGSISYVTIDNSGIDTIGQVTTTELSAGIRWAPHEQFYIGKLYRVPIVNKYPIIALPGPPGSRDYFGGQYTYQNLDLNFYKRFWEGPLGYTDITTDFGYIIGKVPFPLAEIHHANQTYAYQLQSYNLMNFLEFVSDHYATAYIDHSFNGFFFNKIPLLKKLKWREVVEAKILFGGLRDENNPAPIPSRSNSRSPMARLETFSLTNVPYIEGGFGISNIFKLVRVDFIKRFTYLNHPDIPTWGIRVRTKFDF